MKKLPLAPVGSIYIAIKTIVFSGLLGMATLSTWADSKVPAVPPSPKYLAECAASHIAYPVGMLPAPSWRRMMGSLDKHYGSDASMDEASVREISQWLQANAGTYKRVREEPPQDRITTSAWFVRKHDELPAAIWKQAAIKSAANCAACHTRADKGSFKERDISFPPGLDARFRRHWWD